MADWKYIADSSNLTREVNNCEATKNESDRAKAMFQIVTQRFLRQFRIYDFIQVFKAKRDNNFVEIVMKEIREQADRNLKGKEKIVTFTV